MQTPPARFNVSDSPTPPSGGSSQGLVDQAQDKVGQVVDQAQQTAGQVTEQAKQQATSQLATQKDRAVDALVTVGQALRQTGQHLNEQDQGAMGTYVEQAAERVEGMTNHLRSRDVQQLLAETEQLARRQPGMFVAAAVALGFLGGRFLMSSGQRATAQRSFGAPSGSASPYGQAGSVPGTPSFAPPGAAYDTLETSRLPSSPSTSSTGTTGRALGASAS